MTLDKLTFVNERPKQMIVFILIFLNFYVVPKDVCALVFNIVG